jgi:small GTP-binding protein
LTLFITLAAFLQRTVTLDDVAVRFKIWDPAGQGVTSIIIIIIVFIFRNIGPMYYQGAAAAILVYDISKKDSFNNIKNWVKELKSRCDPNVVIALVGNKCDMKGKQRKVKTEEAKTYARENNMIFMEISVKTGHNVQNLFVEIAKKLSDGNVATAEVTK